MPSSSRALTRLVTVVLGLSLASRADAEPAAPGFVVERLYPSAPGGGWFVMDALDMRGGLGGDVSISTGYSKDPLRISQGSHVLDVVANDAFVDFGFAATEGRFRLYLNLDVPLTLSGQSGTVGGYTFTAPAAGPADTPDTFFDARVGVDVRLFGGPSSPFRFGAGAQLYVPIDEQTYYDSDGTYRAMFRALFAGDVGRWSYAGQLGVHVRPLDATGVPDAPEGSELLFGVAGGARLPLAKSGGTVLVVGPEVFGETALRSFFGGATTGLEGLMTGRIEGTADDGPQLRVKLGGGGGIVPQFGAPEWRIVFGLELFDHGGDRDGDGVPDHKDACPDRAGLRTSDPKTNGCPAIPPM